MMGSAAPGLSLLIESRRDATQEVSSAGRSVQLQELLECLTADGLISFPAPFYPSCSSGGLGLMYQLWMLREEG